MKKNFLLLAVSWLVLSGTVHAQSITPADNPMLQTSTAPSEPVSVGQADSSGYSLPESYYESQNQTAPTASPGVTQQSAAAPDVSSSGSSSGGKKGERKAKGWKPKKPGSSSTASSSPHEPQPQASPVVESQVPVDNPPPAVVVNETAPPVQESAPAPAPAPTPVVEQQVSNSAPPPSEPVYTPPPAVEEPPPANTDVAGYDGGFFLKDRAGKFSLTINGRFQPRFSVNVAEDIEDKHSFILRRAFLVFSGYVFSDKLLYEMAVLPTTPGASIGNGILTYAVMPEFALTAGYDTIPFGHGNSQSSGKLIFLDNSLPVQKFQLGSSVGIWATGTIGKVFYAAGVFNGADIDLARNENTEMAYGMRWGWNILGDYGSGEPDLANSPEPNLMIEASGGLHHEESGTQAKVYHGSTALGLKWHGVGFLMEGFARYIDPNEFTREQVDLGYTIHVGYFLIPEKFELGLRHSALLDDINDVGINQNMTAGNIGALGGQNIAVDVNGDSDNEYEYSFAANYYISGNTVKLQSLYSLVIDGLPGPDDRVNHVFVVQAQVGF